METSFFFARGRIDALDSLRGIAVAVVLCNHIRNLVPALADAPDWVFTRSPLHWLVAGHEFVILFFVLSGFVLARPFCDPDAAPRPGRWIAGRICRLYLPYACTVLAAWGLWALTAAGRADLAPITHSWTYPADGRVALSHLALSGLQGGNVLVPPAWTLVYEMRFSLLLPFLAPLICRGGAGQTAVLVTLAALAGIAAGTAYGGITGTHHLYMARDAGGSLLLTVFYLPFFCAGAALAARADALTAALRRAPPALHGAMLAATVALPVLAGGPDAVIARLAGAGAAAAYAILCALAFPRFAAALERPALLWLGRRSYSLYLAHLPIFLAVLYASAGILPPAAGVALALPLAFATAELLHRLAERPATALGRRLRGR